MNWDAIGASAELLSALGVIASLIYLATQVRSSVVQSRQAAVQSVQLQTNAALASVSDNRQLAEVYTKALGGLDALADTAEVIQISSIYLRMLRIYEELYSYRKTGMVDDWAWTSVHSLVVSIASCKGFSDWWNTRGHWFSPEFQAYMRTVMPAEGRDISEDYAEVRQLRE